MRQTTLLTKANLKTFKSSISILGEASMNIKKYLSKGSSTQTLEYLTIVMGLFGHLASYIQAFKIFYLHSAYAVSLLACLIGLISMGCWLFYGFQKKIKPLVIANIFGMVGITLVIGGVLCYG